MPSAATELGQKVARRLARVVGPSSSSDAGPTEEAKPSRQTAPTVVFVLGSQRSGTNALRRSLSLDPWLMGFNERANDRWYRDWKLKPEEEIREDLRRLPGSKVLFKPIVNLQEVPVLEFLEQWDGYRVSVAWIYRDPVDVYYSRKVRWSEKDDVAAFVREWHEVNGPVVDAIDADGRFSLVRYEDLARDKQVFWGLARRLQVHGENLFRAGPSKGRARLDEEVIGEIDRGCADLLAELDRRRSFLPGPEAEDGRE